MKKLDLRCCGNCRWYTGTCSTPPLDCAFGAVDLNARWVCDFWQASHRTHKSMRDMLLRHYPGYDNPKRLLGEK
jgi:hypothetical protein